MAAEDLGKGGCKIMWSIPFIAAACYLIGGQWWKPARWFMGVPIASIALINGYPWYCMLAIPAYWIATSAFPYGEKSWLNFLGEYGKYAVVGFVLGLCSFCCCPFIFACFQSILSALFFTALHYLDEKDLLKNPWQELLRGFLGTVVYFIA